MTYFSPLGIVITLNDELTLTNEQEEITVCFFREKKKKKKAER